MSAHMSNSSSSSVSSVPAHERELAVFLRLYSITPSVADKTSIILPSGGKYGLMGNWFNKSSVRAAFLDWMTTNPHKVNGPMTTACVNGEWYCNSAEQRFAKLTLKGREIMVFFTSRATNPDAVTGPYQYSLMILNPEYNS